MSEPRFLRRAEIESIHAATIEAFGGSMGIRDDVVLESALAQPLHEYLYRSADLYDIAAAYAFHLAENQPFVDGNKRVALLAALNFLAANDVLSETPVPEFYDAMIAIAEKRMNKAMLADVFRRHLSS